MSDTLVLVLTALLAVGVPCWTVWGIWRTTRNTPSRQHALANVVCSIAGTTLLGVVLPAVLLPALDPFPIWLIYAALTAGAATVLVWRWPALKPGNGVHRSLVITSCVLLAVPATAGHRRNLNRTSSECAD